MADVLSILVEILKIDQSLVSEYAAQGPIYQIFFLLFFPMLFIALLVWIIANKWIQHKAFTLLIEVAVFAFIILQGWYNWFVYLSKFWLFLLVFLGVLWFFFGRKKLGAGGQPAGVRTKTLFGELKGKAKKIVTDELTGSLKVEVHAIEKQLDLIENRWSEAESGGNEMAKTEMTKTVSYQLLQLKNDIKRLRDEYGPIPQVINVENKYKKVAGKIGEIKK